MLGQIGLPGGGFGHGYGSMNEPGLPPLRCRLPTLPQGLNPVRTFIPVAAVSDMLLHPGRGVRLQRAAADLSRHPAGVLGRRQPVPPPPEHPAGCAGRSAGPTPSSCTSPYWTAMAKHADIVVPSTTAFERDDYSGSRNDPLLMAMPALAEPLRAVPRRLQTFAALADRLGFGEQFTEGRTARQWLAHLYDKWSADWISTCRRSRSSGGAGRLRLPTEDGLTLLGRLPRRSRRRTGWAPRAAGSRSSPPTSTASATTTAPAIRPGTSPTEWLGGDRAPSAIRCT